MSTLRPVVSIVLFATFLAAASQAATLGPEQPLAPPQIIAAPFAQIAPSIASTGTSALAVWLDARGSVPGLQQRTALYASSLDDRGQPLAPLGVEIAHDVYAAKVATTGQEFLVVYTNAADGRIYAMRTLDGTPSAAPVQIGQGTIVDLAANATSYCAIVADFGRSQYAAMVLDSDGWPVANVALADEIDAVVATHTSYVAIGSVAHCDGVSECTRNITTTRITESGNMTHDTIASNKPYWLRTGAAAGDQGALVAWVSESVNGRVTEAVTIDDDGHKKGATRTVHTTTALPYIGSDLGPSVAFDGARYLVGFPVPAEDAVLRAYYLVARLDESGVPLDSYPTALSSAMDSGFVAAEINRDMLLVWSERGDLFARTMHSFSSIDEAGDPDVIVARAPNVQSNTSLAVAGDVALAAWVEGEHANAIVATVFTPVSVTSPSLHDTQPVTLAGFGNVTYAAPSVAAAGDRFIVIWRESFDDETRVYAQRIDKAGAKLDAEPLLLDVAHGSALDSMTDTAVTSDGTSFFAVWRHEMQLYGAMIPRTGSASAPFRVDRTDGNFHARMSPSIAWTGSMYLVVWQFDPRNPYILAPPTPPSVFVHLARVSAAGALLDTSSSPLVATMNGSAESVAIAAGRERALVVFPVEDDQSCVRGVMLASDGQVVAPLDAFDCAASNFGGRDDVAVTWSGDAFTAAWTRATGSVSAARIGENGSSIERFTLSPAGEKAWAPALAPFGERETLAAYVHVTSDAQYGNVGRVYARTFRGAGKRRSVH